jgi:hypothetical protein
MVKCTISIPSFSYCKKYNKSSFLLLFPSHFPQRKNFFIPFSPRYPLLLLNYNENL